MPAEWPTVTPRPLVGRDRELDELCARLRSHRLVTVVGPGGVGKTALAQHAFEAVADQHPAGARHVDLTRVTSEDTTPDAIAAQLGFAAFDGVLAWLIERRVLLLVDNCEHVLTAAATAISQLVRASAGTTVLSTSRSPLELPGESVLALAPLPVPAEHDVDPSSSPAFQLFVDRARDAGAPVSARDHAGVVTLCRQLDGLPLAIEIAAARSRTMSIADIATRLGDGVDVLERPRFRGPPRHRSVAETIGWTYGQLDESTADVLDRLGVFAGPFTAADAAEIVDRGLDLARVERIIHELVDLSLVVADRTTAPTRFRLLDTIRRFALARLDATNRRNDAFDRFADHAVGQAGRALELGTTSWDLLLPHLEASFDTMLEALRWCVRHDREPDRAMTLCAVLWPLGRYARTLGVARQLFDRWPDERTPVAAAAAVTLAYCESTDGSARRAAEVAERYVAVLAEPALPSVMLRRALGHARLVLGEPAAAAAAFHEGIAVARSLGMVEAAIDLTVSEAEVVAYLGDVERALTTLADARDEAAEIGSRMTRATAAAAEAWVLVTRDGPAARTAVERALDEARAIPHHGAVIANLRSLLHVQMLSDDLPGASRTVRAWLDAVVSGGLSADARSLVGAAAWLAHRVGEASWSALAATHQSMPIELLPSRAGTALYPLPEVAGVPIPSTERLAAVAASLAAVETLLSGAGGEPCRPAATDAAPSMRLAGQVWEVRFRQRSVAVRNTKGLRDIATLLATPGREIHCLDLVGAAVEQRSTGEVIDADARRRYEARIRDLQHTVEEAEADNDYLRAERARLELDAVVDHLTAALGHGGRVRRGGDSAERARSTVTQRIRATIRQLDAAHPALARHLRASIKTGVYCSYRPEEPTTWEVSG